jgi:predicted AlkP superfamily pyrophosphatase or phosphodiesterase
MLRFLVVLATAGVVAGCNRPPPRRMGVSGPPAAVACVGPKPSQTASAAALGTRRAIAQRVIIISEDGMRPDALAQARAPMHARLLREGAWSLRARTSRQASTLPAHAAMLSGFDVAEHGITWNSWRPERGFIKVPTVFTAAGSAGKGAAAFVGKRKLAHIARPGTVDVFERPGFFCRKVAEQAAAYFVEKTPQIEFVHFSDPDERGHAKGWMSAEQLEAIAATDRCLATLIGAVERAGMAHETLVIISADHGGRGRNHSGHHQHDRLIPWIAWGAGVRPGHQIRAPVTTFDTAATALWALGHEPPPGLVGRPIVEAFAVAD